MTKIKTVALAASVIALSFFTMRGVAASVGFDVFKVSPAVSLNLPATPADSLQASKNSFSRNMLLSAINSRLTSPSGDWTLVEADTASVVRLSKPAAGAEIRTLATRLRPSAFVSGMLRMKSNVIADLKSGHNTLLTVSAADSAASWVETPFSLEPERTADLYITYVSMPDDPAQPEIELEFVPAEGFDNVSFATGPDITKRFLIENTALGTRLYKTSISRRKIYHPLLQHHIRQGLRPLLGRTAGDGHRQDHQRESALRCLLARQGKHTRFHCPHRRHIFTLHHGRRNAASDTSCGETPRQFLCH